MDIEKQLQELKEARESAAHYHAAAKKMLDEVKASDEFSSYAESARFYDDKVFEIDSAIRAAAVAEYEATKNKSIHPKVTVKIFKTFKILDAKKVWDWAFGNLPAALKLDEKKIEKYALEFGEVEGTERGEETRAQIAAEL